MRKKLMRGALLAAAIVAIVSSCVSCQPVSVGPWGRTTDKEALVAQVAMRSAVQVRVTYSLDVSSIDPTKTHEMRFAFGSGTVVSDGKTSVVLTAWHACAPQRTAMYTVFGPELSVVAQTFAVITADGETLAASVRGGLPESDLCTLDVVGDAGVPARIASSPPPLGALVIYAGGPRGVWGLRMIPTFDGRYAGRSRFTVSGIERDGMLFTFPIAPGSSGSGVFYDGELVAIVVAGDEFEHLSYAIDVAAAAQLIGDRTTVEVSAPRDMVDVESPVWP